MSTEEDKIQWVINALEHPNYTFRSIEAVSKQIGLPLSEVREIIGELELGGQLIKSSITDHRGRATYTTIKHYTEKNNGSKNSGNEFGKAEEQQSKANQSGQPDTANNSIKDFFISYNFADKNWAEWIAWQLEEAGFSTILQAWDFRPGCNFVLKMQEASQKAKRTIAVLSPNYLRADFAQPEWAAAFIRDPKGIQGILLPIIVQDCRKELAGLWPQIVHINLVGLTEQTARKVLLKGLNRDRIKPSFPPVFPGPIQHKESEEPHFPGNSIDETRSFEKPTKVVSSNTSSQQISSPNTSSKPIEIFYSYSHKDEKLRDRLETHLSLLRQQGVLISWYDRRIGPGNEYAKEIDTHLNAADIILLLVSPDFLASNYCYGIEMKRAMERHEKGEAVVIPVLLRPVHWKEAPFGKLQALPTEARPITDRFWHNQDEAFYDVAEGIREVIKKLTLQHHDVENSEIEALRNALFKSKIFSNIKPPVIGIFGATGVGKTSLVRMLYGKEIDNEAVTGINAGRVDLFRFPSGLIIYDTLGLSDLSEERTAIFEGRLGVRLLTLLNDNQLKKLTDDSIIERLAVITKPDLYILVLSALRIRSFDLYFYETLPILITPIIMVINQIDMVQQDEVEKIITSIEDNFNQHPITISSVTGLSLPELFNVIQNDKIPQDEVEKIIISIEDNFKPHPIAVSSVTGQNLPELFNAIMTNLPFECREAIKKELAK